MKHRARYAPLLSIGLITATLLVVVITKMETRRLAYSLLKLSREEKLRLDDVRLMGMKFLNLTRPEYIEVYASRRLALQKAQKGQIIQLAGDYSVIR